MVIGRRHVAADSAQPGGQDSVLFAADYEVSPTVPLDPALGASPSESATTDDTGELLVAGTAA